MASSAPALKVAHFLKTQWQHCAAICVFCLLGLMYVDSLPQTVQFGDGGELAINSWGLHIMHPPGFPLATWLFYFFGHSFSFGSVFFRAALFNTIISLACLLVIALPLRRHLALVALIVVPFASSKLFWFTTIFPGSIALHLLFVSLIVALSFSRLNASSRFLLISFVFGLALANELTIVYLLPMYLVAAWETNRKWDFALGLGITSLVALSLYLSLLFISSGHRMDWQELNSLGDLLNHFQRQDFGALHHENGVPFNAFWQLAYAFYHYLVFELPLSMFAVFGTIAVLFFRTKNCNQHHSDSPSRRVLAVFASVILYVLIYFSFVNSPAGQFAYKTERHFLMPGMLLMFLTAWSLNEFWSRLSRQLRIAIGALAVTIGINNYQNYQALFDYSGDTAIEDFAIDLLYRAQNYLPSIVVSRSDNFTYPALYVQEVLGLHRDVSIISPTSFGKQHQLKNLKKRTPEVVVSEEWWTQQNNLAGTRQLIEKNLGLVNIFFPNLNGIGLFAFQQFKVGVRLAAAPQVHFEDTMPITNRMSSNRLRLGPRVPSLMVFENRCDYFVRLADEYFHADDRQAALLAVRQALAVVPFCISAKKRECEILRLEPNFGRFDLCFREFQEIRLSLRNDD